MEPYVKICEWMLGLGLKCTEINALAVIWSFGKGGEWFQGSASYLGRWMGVKKKETVYRALSSLEQKGLVEKRDRWERGEKFCDYRPGPKIGPPGPKNGQGGGPKNGHHINSADSNRDKEEIKNKEIHLSVEEFRKEHMK